MILIVIFRWVINQLITGVAFRWFLYRCFFSNIRLKWIMHYPTCSEFYWGEMYHISAFEKCVALCSVVFFWGTTLPQHFLLIIFFGDWIMTSTIHQWIGLREHLQETMVLLSNLGVSPNPSKYTINKFETQFTTESDFTFPSFLGLP